MAGFLAGYRTGLANGASARVEGEGTCPFLSASSSVTCFCECHSSHKGCVLPQLPSRQCSLSDTPFHQKHRILILPRAPEVCMQPHGTPLQALPFLSPGGDRRFAFWSCYLCDLVLSFSFLLLQFLLTIYIKFSDKITFLMSPNSNVIDKSRISFIWCFKGCSIYELD